MTDSRPEFFDLYPLYTEYSNRWRTVNDVVEGEPVLKAKDLAKYGTYLIEIPQNGSDAEYYNLRNRNYIKGAVFSNITEATLVGYMGMLFRAAPALPELPPEIEYLVADSNGSGLTLEQHARNTAEQVVKIGRHGVLVDMPPSLGRPATKAEIAAGFRAKFKSYSAQAIQFWRINSLGKVDAIILQESIAQQIDGEEFKTETKTVWRVLRLEDGVYTVEVVDNKGNPVEPKITPTDASGKTLNIIPFICFGSMDNVIDVDPLPLEPIALVNLGHYRNVADEESSSHQLSAATPWVADSGYQQFLNDPNKKELKAQTMGEMGFVVLGTGGQAGFMQVNANTQVSKLREDKEKQMIALGAQVVTPSGPAETAEAVRTHKSSQGSRIQVIGINLSSGYTMLLEWAALFMGGDVKEPYTLNQKFFDKDITPDELREMVASWQAGAYSHRILLEKLQGSGFLPEDEDLEQLQQEAENESPVIGLE